MTTPFDFAGTTAVVTGAASGIGRAIACALAHRGVNLGLVDVDARGLAETQDRILATGRRVAARTADVSDDAAVRAAASAFDRELGAIHLLFNNAGVDASGALESLSHADWQRAFGVNVFGVVNGLSHFLPLMHRHGQRAHVVNTASGAGFWVSGDVRMGAYAATKYAVVAISEALEQELAGSRVGVSVLCPGPVATHIAERSPRAERALRESIAAGAAPQLAAEIALGGVQRGDFYIFTPTRMRARVQARHERILEALDRVPQAAP
ncbi:MAG TPA: SDR family NAD(P)-dependent oxidoreductase [Ramlibacter sp.]|uniref:SDR family NAD(P)-dependent oxidoreductase n=1 Tax=Ramlibacter sp. TaxID=1917967 RepID=UPI002BA25577|nr:SDR family NAD(P)-dependent oxidoreductase [Ramlibacter sp.]HVZ45911.1 SDR family NAD(P)-dependent oxidoreductase [Ramlibacter sp.]